MPSWWIWVLRRVSSPAWARAQLVDLALPRRRGKDRQNGRLARHAESTALCDHQRVDERFRQIGEQLRHLGGGLEPVLRRDPTPLALSDLGAVRDAQQDVVRLPARAVDEVHIVGRDQRQVARHREINQRRLDLFLHLEAVAHHLDVQPTGKEFLELREQAFGAAAISARERTPDRPVEGACQRDQTAGECLQILELEFREPGLGVERERESSLSRLP